MLGDLHAEGGETGLLAVERHRLDEEGDRWVAPLGFYFTEQ